MKSITILCLLMTQFSILINAQPEDNNAIKIFISESSVRFVNASVTESQEKILKDRLYRKVTQIINQNAVAEIGYSSFLVVATFDVISTDISQAGISSVHLAECELDLTIKRTSGEFYGSGEAAFNSTSKKIMGSGSSKYEAIANAVNGISGKDGDISKFLMESKIKIDNFYKTNCMEVLKQAEQFLALKNYEGSIALYFSVPSNAPCYQDALDASQKVYVTYIEDLCNKRLVKLKAYVALAQSENLGNKNYYDSAMYIMSNLSPASDKCYIESMKEIEKIEKRLNEKQKNQWEVVKKVVDNSAEVKKERYKAMGRISKNYQPPPAPTNVIIAK